MRTILHVDMDAFFASVEELRNPSLRGKPLAVTGAGERTVVTTASYAARARGVKTGMSRREALRRCPELLLVVGDHHRYTRASSVVFRVLERFTPLVEPSSVDEAYLDTGWREERWEEAGKLGKAVREAVRKETGLSCSVGVAPNKLLAKLASDMDKPGGVTVLSPPQVPALLETLPVGELCGIGPRTAEALRSLGVERCGQLGRFPLPQLLRRFGVLGERFSRMGRGEDNSPVLSPEEKEPVRSVGHSVTLARDLVEREEMERVLLTLAEMVGRRARRHGCAGRSVSLTLRYADRSTFSRQSTLPSPLRCTEEIYRAARAILQGISLAQPVRLLGVSLGQLEFGPHQGSLLAGEERRERLQETVDRVNDRYGEFSLGPAELIRDLGAKKVISPAWRPRGIRRSAAD